MPERRRPSWVATFRRQPSIPICTNFARCRCRLAGIRSRNQASVSGLTLHPLRKAKLRLPTPLPAEDAHPLSSAIRPARRPHLPCCPMLSGVPTYDCASVTKDRFPG
jgi:hypothetical protein